MAGPPGGPSARRLRPSAHSASLALGPLVPRVARVLLPPLKDHRLVLHEPQARLLLQGRKGGVGVGVGRRRRLTCMAGAHVMLPGMVP